MKLPFMTLSRKAYSSQKQSCVTFIREPVLNISKTIEELIKPTIIYEGKT